MEKITPMKNEETLWEITGKVTNVFYTKEQPEYSIGTFSSDQIDPKYLSERKTASIKGSRILKKGTKYTFKGLWNKDEKYGWTFIFKECTEFQSFSRNTNNTSSNKKSNISEEHSKLLSFLTPPPLKVSPSLVEEIYKAYGEESMEVINFKPYSIFEKMPEIDLDLVDKIAKNSIARVRMMIIQELNKLSNCSGHVYFPITEFEHHFNEDFKNCVSQVALKESLQYLQKSNHLKIHDFKGANIVYSSALGYMEEFIATKANELATDCIPIKNLDNLIKTIEEHNSITYAENQVEALKGLNSGSFQIITGGPGTGKSTIIKAICQILKIINPNINIKMAAPTGRASKRMEESTGEPASTIHRLLEYHVINGFQRNAKKPLECDVLIIDESSMIDLPLMYHFIQAIKRGTRLIMIGDIDQLPPVGVGYVFRDLIESETVPTTRLNRVFRQGSDSAIKINAAKIRDGDTSLIEKQGEFEFYLDFRKNEDIEKFIVDKFSELLEQERKSFEKCGGRGKDPIYQVQILCPMRVKILGVNSLNRKIQQIVNPSTPSKKQFVCKMHSAEEDDMLDDFEMTLNEVVFREKDKIMQMNNNYKKDVYNGDLGIIRKITNTSVIIDFEDGKEISYFKSEIRENIELAYATTIHKSQGSEYNTAIIVNSLVQKNMLQRNLLYTGVTRAKKIALIVGDIVAVDTAIKTVVSNKRYSRLKDLLIQEKEKTTYLQNTLFRRILAFFTKKAS